MTSNTDLQRERLQRLVKKGILEKIFHLGKADVRCQNCWQLGKLSSHEDKLGRKRNISQNGGFQFCE